MPRKRKLPTIPVIRLREQDRTWHILKSKGSFIVTGPRIEKFASRTRFSDYHGQQRLRDILHKMGIMEELERKGIEPEQDIVIGQPEIGRLEY